MKNKLALTIEDKVIDSAKKYAREKGRSLSDIVESYLKSITSQVDTEDTAVSPKVLKLMGSVKSPQDFDYKSALGNELAKKYE